MTLCLICKREILNHSEGNLHKCLIQCTREIIRYQNALTRTQNEIKIIYDKMDLMLYELYKMP